MDFPSQFNIQPIGAYDAWQQAGTARDPRSAGGALAADPFSETLKRTPAADAPVECQTCKNRTYVDGSNDASVSFKTPTKLSPGQALSAVRSHEQEHVVNDRASVEEKGGRVVSQSVAIHYAVCPECGRVYVSGGTTTTISKSGGAAAAGGKSRPTRAAETGRIIDARA